MSVKIDVARLAKALDLCGIGFVDGHPPSTWAEGLAAEYARLAPTTGADRDISAPLTAEERESVARALQVAGEREARVWTSDKRPVVGTWGDRIVDALNEHGFVVVRRDLSEPRSRRSDA